MRGWNLVLTIKYSKLAKWLVIYELVYVATSIIVGLIILYSSRASSIESTIPIENNSTLNIILYLWLSNTTYFLITSAFIILHPVLGVFIVAFTSISSAKLLASLLASYYNTMHFVYRNLEIQAYIILWVIAAKTYYGQQECNNLMCKWTTTLKLTSKLLIYAFTIFLILAIIGVIGGIRSWLSLLQYVNPL